MILLLCYGRFIDLVLDVMVDMFDISQKKLDCTCPTL